MHHKVLSVLHTHAQQRIIKYWILNYQQKFHLQTADSLYLWALFQYLTSIHCHFTKQVVKINLNAIWWKNVTNPKFFNITQTHTYTHTHTHTQRLFSVMCSHPPASSETRNQGPLQALRGSHAASGWVWFILRVILWREPITLRNDFIIIYIIYLPPHSLFHSSLHYFLSSFVDCFCYSLSSSTSFSPFSPSPLISLSLYLSPSSSRPFSIIAPSSSSPEPL